MKRAELVLDCSNQHGEGIFWNPVDQRVWWTDIEGQMIWAYDPVSDVAESFDMPGRVCCFAPRQDGGFIVAFADRVSLFDLQAGELRTLYRFEPDNTDTRLNDGRTDRDGNFVLGGMNEVSGAANSSVIKVMADHSVSTLITGVSCANSICFSPDGSTLFFSDSPERTIRAFDYSGASQSLGGAKWLADFSELPGLPDGSCVDAQGGVWNAVWEGRRVVRVAPDGTIDQVIEVPVWKPTCCAFGGPKLDTLFITTSCLMSSSEQIAAEPGSGGLFAVKPGVGGVIDQPFAG